MKIALAALMIATMPAYAESVGDRSNRQAYESQRGYASENKCFRYEYREEYVPGTSQSPGYVKSYNEKIAVPCSNTATSTFSAQPEHRHHDEDGNDCSQGAILGGIAGAGAGAALSRDDGRWWAIPLGIVGGSMIGCDIDGG